MAFERQTAVRAAGRSPAAVKVVLLFFSLAAAKVQHNVRVITV